jgi:hypothetical protein
VTDFRAFLGAKSELVLPYFGGTRVDAPDRRLRVTGEHEPGQRMRPTGGDLVPGWYRFRVDGRRAVPLEPAAPGDLSDRPVVRGHWAEGWLFSTGRDASRVAFSPDDEPSPLARCTGRRWYSGDLLFDTLDFEDDAELGARDALERGQTIGELRGAVPSLRAAFGFAVAAAVGRELRIPVSPREVTGKALAIADGGRDAAREILHAIADERRRYAEERERELRRIREAEAAAERIRTEAAESRARREKLRDMGVMTRERSSDARERADSALDSAGARMLGCRRMAGDLLDVRFELDGQRFSSIVHAETLQVIDAGICLAGADRVLTLDSLPSVIREAIEEDILHITRFE